MTEKYVIIDGLSIVYSGYFSLSKLYKLIDLWIANKDYVKVELKNIEQVTERGRYIELEIAPYKEFNDYAKSTLHVVVYVTNLKDKIVKIGNHEERINDGNIQIKFDGILETDYARRWRSKPSFMFIRALVDKYIFRTEYHKFKDKVYRDTMTLHDEIKSYLNLNKF